MGNDDPGDLFEDMIRMILERSDPDATDDEITALIGKATDAAAPVIVEQLHTDATRMLIDHRSVRAGFEVRLQDPWGPAFDRFETLYVAGSEAGERYIERLAKEANDENDQVFTVLVRLHARACHVISEIYALLRTGHATGAHARWRTLHEIAVVMAFVSEQPAEVAERYLSHEAIAARDALVARYGADFDREWGWAAEALKPAPPTFRAIETATELDHWRPFFRMASHGVHGGPKALFHDLGVTDALETLIAGPSNYGLADPGMDAAISFGIATTTLLTHRPDLEGLTTAKVIHALVGETVDAFAAAGAELERRIAEEAQGEEDSERPD
jgi:hypothetical protein